MKCKETFEAVSYPVSDVYVISNILNYFNEFLQHNATRNSKWMNETSIKEFVEVLSI